MPRTTTIGQCLLTGDIGPFRKSHIIPDAFMRRATDAPFKEWDGAGYVKKSFTGWYDNGILGERGEQIIGKYDSAAAICFIENGFTYRTRRNPKDISSLLDDFVPATAYSIPVIDADTLHLFALSLLWRAAVSSHPAFAHIRVRPKRLEEIRIQLLTGVSGGPDEFPAYFTVFCGSEELPKMSPTRIAKHPFIRFFLDGVICYVSPTKRAVGVEKFSALFVGRDPRQVGVVCVPSATSGHATYSRTQAAELFEKFGDIFGRGARP